MFDCESLIESGSFSWIVDTQGSPLHQPFILFTVSSLFQCGSFNKPELFLRNFLVEMDIPSVEWDHREK